MVDQQRTPERIPLDVSRDELLLLQQALNEVCNGVDIEDWEFSTRLGSSREEAEALMDRISLLLDSLRANESSNSFAEVQPVPA
jgi:hypothetical protein